MSTFNYLITDPYPQALPAARVLSMQLGGQITQIEVMSPKFEREISINGFGNIWILPK